MKHAKEQLQKLVVQRDEMIHSRKMVEEMSKRHGEESYPSLAVLLWFAELFRLIPKSITSSPVALER